MRRRNIQKKKRPNNFFDKVFDSIKAIEDSLKFFFVYPKSAVPLVGCWMVYATIILYMEYSFEWSNYSTSTIFLTVYMVYFCFSMLLGITSLVTLEIVQQIESSGQVSIIKAYWDTYTKNLLKALPILIVWSMFWFFLAIIGAITSRFNGKSKGNYSVDPLYALNL